MCTEGGSGSSVGMPNSVHSMNLNWFAPGLPTPCMPSSATSRRAGSCAKQERINDPPLQCAMDTACAAQ